MIRVGESTGSLDDQLQTAATFYERELTYRLKRFTDMFEPTVIILVGGAVAFVAIAQISAMYSIYSQVAPRTRSRTSPPSPHLHQRLPLRGQAQEQQPRSGDQQGRQSNP